MAGAEAGAAQTDRNGTDARSLLKRFYTLHEERLETFSLFEEGFVAYLEAAPNYNFPLFRQLIHEVTQTFKRISEEIIQLQAALQDEHDQKPIAGCIAKIQEEEAKKLETTAALQIARQNVVDHPQDDSYKAEVEELRHKLQTTSQKLADHMEDLKFESEDLYDNCAGER